MKHKIIPLVLGILFILSVGFVFAISVDVNYITIFPGEQGTISIDIDNTGNFDIEDVTFAIDLGGKKIFNSLGVLVEETVALPFSILGSSEKDLDDLDEKDDDRVHFTLRAATDITPGDYNIPYTLKYVNADDVLRTVIEQTGSFGLRVSAKTDIDFAVETRGEAIVGRGGKISLEIINKGLGEIKSVYVQIYPSGFELLSKDKIFIGTIDSDDTDLATFDVIYRSTSPMLSAIIQYKDFDNNDQTATISLPIKVYTEERALELGIIQEDRRGTYVGVVIVLIIIWVIYRKVKKRRRRKKKEGR